MALYKYELEHIDAKGDYTQIYRVSLFGSLVGYVRQHSTGSWLAHRPCPYHPEHYNVDACIKVDCIGPVQYGMLCDTLKQAVRYMDYNAGANLIQYLGRNRRR